MIIIIIIIITIVEIIVIVIAITKIKVTKEKEKKFLIRTGEWNNKFICYPTLSSDVNSINSNKSIQR